MDSDKVYGWLVAHPYGMKMGAKNIACRLRVDEESVRAAKVKYKRGSHVSVLPKVLLFDLETAPMKAYVWSRWKQNVRLEQTISESYIICWSAKWLYGDEVMSGVLTGEEAKKEDDKRIVEDLWVLINEADIVIAHNALGADVPWMNSRFIVHGLVPPKPYQVIDTLKESRRVFGFSSHSLDALGTYFGVGNKIDTSFELWRGCVEGDESCLAEMVRYNKQDVKLLEEVYLRLMPWIKGHPNIGNMIQEDVCPCCGGRHVVKMEDRYYYTSVGRYQLYRCSGCGTVFRDRMGDKSFKPKAIALR